MDPGRNLSPTQPVGLEPSAPLRYGDLLSTKTRSFGACRRRPTTAGLWRGLWSIGPRRSLGEVATQAFYKATSESRLKFCLWSYGFCVSNANSHCLARKIAAEVPKLPCRAAGSAAEKSGLGFSQDKEEDDF